MQRDVSKPNNFLLHLQEKAFRQFLCFTWKRKDAGSIDNYVLENLRFTTRDCDVDVLTLA